MSDKKSGKTPVPPSFDSQDEPETHWSLQEVDPDSQQSIRVAFTSFIQYTQDLLDFDSAQVHRICDWMINFLRKDDERYADFPAHVRKTKRGYYGHIYKHVYNQLLTRDRCNHFNEKIYERLMREAEDRELEGRKD